MGRSRGFADDEMMLGLGSLALCDIKQELEIEKPISSSKRFYFGGEEEVELEYLKWG